MKNDEPQEKAAYAGRWVARVQGKIVAQGHTADDARRGAQAQRHKEKVEISFIPGDPLARFAPFLDRVAAVAAGQQVFLVGGAVRDALLGGGSHDFDFTLARGAIEFARRVGDSLGADFYVLDESFDAARVIVSQKDGIRDVLDFTGFRGPDLRADLAGRDFTINAIAYDLQSGQVSDPLGGAMDLRARSIRACSSSSVQDDPVRVLRAVRLAAMLDFRIEPDTRRAMKDAVRLLPQVSPERNRDELFRILNGPRPDAALRALEILGVFPHLLAELSALKGTKQSAPHVFDVWEHTLSVIHHLDEILATLGGDAHVGGGGGLLTGLLSGKLGRYRQQITEHLSKSPSLERSLRSLLFFAALYHDVSKPLARTTDTAGRLHFHGHEAHGARVAEVRCRELRLSNEETSHIASIIRHHMHFPLLARRTETKHELPSRRAIYHFFRDLGKAGPEPILLGLADLRGVHGPTLTERAWIAYLDTARTLLQNLWEKPQEAVSPARLVDGSEIMTEFGLEQGRTVGRLLQAIQEAQATGAVTTRDQAMDFARRWLKSNGAS